MNRDYAMPATATALRSQLLALATREEHLAADEAAATPYWKPWPPSVLAHRMAVALLREEADFPLVGDVP